METYKGEEMKEFVGIVGGIVIVVIVFYIRFTHIDMTETRLFVEFWPIWVAMLIFGALWAFLLDK